MKTTCRPTCNYRYIQSIVEKHPLSEYMLVKVDMSVLVCLHTFLNVNISGSWHATVNGLLG